MRAQKRNLATIVLDQLLHLPQSLQLGGFARDRPLMQPRGERREIVWRSQSPVPQTDTFGADFQQSLLAQIVQRANDPVAIGFERFGGGLYVDGEPGAAFGRLAKYAGQKLTPLAIET